MGQIEVQGNIHEKHNQNTHEEDTEKKLEFVFNSLQLFKNMILVQNPIFVWMYLSHSSLEKLFLKTIKYTLDIYSLYCYGLRMSHLAVRFDESVKLLE